LTLRDRKESKSMNAADQVLVKKADRLRIVSMASEPAPVQSAKQADGDKNNG
jgi:NADH-quinone oxidoreductase subunit J